MAGSPSLDAAAEADLAGGGRLRWLPAATQSALRPRRGATALAASRILGGLRLLRDGLAAAAVHLDWSLGVGRGEAEGVACGGPLARLPAPPSLQGLRDAALAAVLASPVGRVLGAGEEREGLAVGEATAGGGKQQATPPACAAPAPADGAAHRAAAAPVATGVFCEPSPPPAPAAPLGADVAYTAAVGGPGGGTLFAQPALAAGPPPLCAPLRPPSDAITVPLPPSLRRVLGLLAADACLVEASLAASSGGVPGGGLFGVEAAKAAAQAAARAGGPTAAALTALALVRAAAADAAYHGPSLAHVQLQAGLRAADRAVGASLATSAAALMVAADAAARDGGLESPLHATLVEAVRGHLAIEAREG